MLTNKRALPYQYWELTRSLTVVKMQRRMLSTAVFIHMQARRPAPCRRATARFLCSSCDV